jgi:Raf kinase inhibitor-like YbhB/YbcL family protein
MHPCSSGIFSRGALALVLALAAATAACSETRTSAMSMQLESPAFAATTSIPAVHTCDGSDVSPALAWTGVPADARSLVLIVDDPDAPDPAAPQRTWVHWVLYNLPVAAKALPEGVRAAQLPAGTREGRNDWQRPGYGGPCPPVGRHRYFHKLYALDVELPDLHQPDKAALLKAMEGHVLAQAELVGTYQRPGH